MQHEWRPVIGLTPNLDLVRGDSGGAATHVRINRDYLEAVVRAGGVPVLLAPEVATLPAVLGRLDGVILTGGDDVDFTLRGGINHPKADVMHPDRQQFDFALLAALDERPDLPVLGICLGMQEMGLHRGCGFIQHVPDVVADGGRHAGDRTHEVAGAIGRGPIDSAHHQALADAGPFEIVALSDDGLIEGIRDPDRPFHLGVQWHPERTADPHLGDGIFNMLVAACRSPARVTPA
jgi:putative glutamine amidotransferase